MDIVCHLRQLLSYSITSSNIRTIVLTCEHVLCANVINNVLIIIIMLLFRTVVHQDTCIHSMQLNLKKNLVRKIIQHGEW